MSFYLAWLNVALGVINMVPGLPMDGGRVLRSAIWWRNADYMRATRVATLAGQVIGYLLIFERGGPHGSWLLDQWPLADLHRGVSPHRRLRELSTGDPT